LLVTELQQSILRLQKQFQPNSQQLTQQLNKLSQNYLANVIKLFAVSCQSGRECRAAELTYRATAEQGIQAMCTYASKKQRLHLSEKVNK
jgi:hypothetical protein